MLLSDATFVVVDLETTGLSPQHHRITEVALVRVEKGRITERFQSLVNPEQYIPSFIAEHTGITNAMVFGKPVFREVLPEVERFVRQTPGAVVVGHNVSFDHNFLLHSFERAGANWEVYTTGEVRQHLLCTCKLARRFLPKLQRRSLKHVQDYFGIRNTKQHRALHDAEATALILIEFLKLAENLEIETVDELLHFQHARAGAPKKKTKRQVTLREHVKAFPERPGVYTMRDRYGAVLYVGKAKSLRDRVSSYFSDANTRGTKLHQMMCSVKEITYEETGSELSALLLESRKIKELSPRFNSLERRYRTYTFLKLDLQHDFPRLDIVREPMQDGAEYYGPFRSWDTVSALVDVLNRSFTLRECGDNFTVSQANKPCFYYEIHRCSAPCAKLDTKRRYAAEVERLRAFLAAGEEGVLAAVEAMMHKAAEALDFEEAQFLKLRLLELRRVLGRGERSLASLNANDFVILNRTHAGECEVLFARFGRLVKQAVLTPTSLATSEEWFLRQIRLYYGAASAIPPACGKTEIDEMRILSHWCEQRRKRGSSIIYLGADPIETVPRLSRELRSLLRPEAATGATSVTHEPVAMETIAVAPVAIAEKPKKLVKRRMTS